MKIIILSYIFFRYEYEINFEVKVCKNENTFDNQYNDIDNIM